MKTARSFILLLLIMSLFQGCGPLSIVTTTYSIITTAQEVEEEYEGDFSDYMDDKIENTYDYVEEKVSKE